MIIENKGEEPGDTGVLGKLFEHNTWANLALLDFCEGLSSEQLDAAATGAFGSIRDTLVHIAFSEVDYVNLVNEKWPAVPPSSEEFLGFGVLRDGVRWAGEELRQLATTARESAIVRVVRPGEPVFEYPLWGMLLQVLNHSTEHRTQVSAIITQLGIEPPSMSGWAYMRELGILHEFEVGA